MSFKSNTANLLGDLLGVAGEGVASEIIAPTNILTIVRDSLWDLANLLDPRLLLKVASAPTAGTNTITLSDESRILLIERRDTANDALFYPCNEVGYHEHSKYIDASSIYHATNYSPIYYIEGVSSDATTKYGKINVYPHTASTDEAVTRTWLYKAPVVKAVGSEAAATTPTDTVFGYWFWDANADSTATIDNDQAVAIDYYHYKSPPYFPQEAHLALTYLIASRIASQYLVNVLIEDEDTEVAALVKGAITTLEEELKNQLKRLITQEDDKA